MATARDKRNVLVLAVCQALFQIGFAVMFLVGPLVAAPMLGDDLTYVTLPFSMMLAGLAAVAWPAALLMRRIGRKAGFAAGSAVGAAGCVIALFAIQQGSLVAFAAGLFLFGIYTGFGQQYRFAVADVASADFRPLAISLVLAASVIGGFFGPELAVHTRTLIGGDEFAGTMAALMMLTLLSGLVVLLIDIPKLSRSELAEPGRPLGAIIRQPAFIIAITAGALGFVTMNLTMTSAPIAMRIGQGFAFDDTAFVIQWHVVGMFAPGFFTGYLIKRWGSVRVITAGGILMLTTVGVAVSGLSLAHFWISMFVVGVGWNFTFTGGTALLTQLHTPSERAKVQGLNDLIIFSSMTLTSLTSGMLYHLAGWNWVVLAALPIVAIMFAVVIGFAIAKRTAPSDSL
ncbi:MAG: MFS transporter [Rhodospirillales bacterium]|jgi:predicted MFS family arabinose efflux permease|nr:MFS transporter [Rhodospirillales bacterium]MDP6644294.1 MFS transporter [Rhodospirillales bacterium]MDP6842327.1 MFS transporter [Rhodospirillales bacterium]